MRLKIIIVVCILVLTFLAIYNLDLVPLRREISELEIVMIAGMDKLEDGYEISFLKKGEDTSSNSTSLANSTEVVSIKAQDYNTAMRHLQALTDKYITASHIKYYIVGEKTATEDLTHISDTIARGNQIRLNAKVYVSKGTTAKEFLKKASLSRYNIEDKLYNMEDNFWSERTSTDASIINIGHAIVNKNSEGLIATLEFGDLEDSDIDTKIENNNNSKKELNEEIPFGFGGAGIIKDMRVIDFLTTDQTAIANYLMKQNNVNTIKIEENNMFIVFGVEQLNVSVDFNFNKDNIINELVLDATFKANYEEVNAKIPVFTYNKIKYFEEKLNEKVCEQLRNIIAIELEKECDFLGLAQKLEFKHPYKYEKNSNDFLEKLKKCKITINSKGKIQTTYDVVETNIYQEGDTK